MPNPAVVILFNLIKVRRDSILGGFKIHKNIKAFHIYERL